MIAIVDYGMGNLQNVYNALEKLEMKSVITEDENIIKDSDAIIIPGVGAIADAMQALKSKGLDKVIKEFAESGKIVFGICLGMQLLFEKSYEDGEHEALGLLPGEVVRFDTKLKVPHMGWNELHVNKQHPIIKGIKDGERVYFVHSYHLSSAFKEDVVLYTDYDYNVCAMVARDNIIGAQFHPEKSSDTGRKILENFKELVNDSTSSN